MAVSYEERGSDSPFVEAVWHVQAQSDGCDIVVADANWDMIITRHQKETNLTVWGPMTKAANIPHIEGAEAIGIRFKLGTFLTHLPIYSLPDSGTLLPAARDSAFWFNGSAWEYPTFENVETFIQRMVCRGILGGDDIVTAALQGDDPFMSMRSVQRRFVTVTGLTHRSIRAIERAHHAAALLQTGTPILDTVFEAGYSDQQHLTKALKQFLGQTPAQILRSHAP